MDKLQAQLLSPAMPQAFITLAMLSKALPNIVGEVL
jgi:hypothetical protein